MTLSCVAYNVRLRYFQLLAMGEQLLVISNNYCIEFAFFGNTRSDILIFYGDKHLYLVPLLNDSTYITTTIAKVNLREEHKMLVNIEAETFKALKQRKRFLTKLGLDLQLNDLA